MFSIYTFGLNNDANSVDILNYAINKYKLYLPIDIIEHFLVKHSYFYRMFKQFDFLNIQKLKINNLLFSNSKILDSSIIDYADFCVLREESREVIKNVGNKHHIFRFGTWDYPIIVIFINNKYVTIDGNNRLRLLKSFLKFMTLKPLDNHQVLLFSQFIEL